MKHFKQFLLAMLVALVGNLSANAYDFVYNGIYYKIASDNTCWVTCKVYLDKSYSGRISIPSTVTYSGKTYTVAGIEACAFWGCENLTSISIPNTVTYISSSAFFNCNRLSSIVLPNGIKTIGGSAFAHCSSLTSINIPEGVTNMENNPFYGCTSLPVENGVRYADTYAVEAVDKDIRSCILRDGTKYIGDYAFLDCTNLLAVNIPNTVTEIRENAFQGCVSLSEIVSMNTTPPTIYNTGWTFDEVDMENCVVKVPSEALSYYREANYWKDFANIQAFVESTQINDAVPYTRHFDKENTAVAYTRNFTSTNWQPLYIPFNMSYDEWSEFADVAEIRGIYSYDDSEGVEHTVLAFHKLTSGELKPNTPYVIKPKQAGEVTFFCTNKTLTAAENGSVWCASTRKKYTLTGVYEEKADMVGVYAMSGGAFYLGDASSPALNPFRFYLTVEDIDNGYGTGNVQNAPARIQIMVDGETTGIEDVFTGVKNDGCYYDLSGRKVLQPEKGIYIRNGKKVFIK